jgi:hypothetical protein
MEDHTVMSMIQPLVDTLSFNDYIVETSTRDLTDVQARRRLRSDGGPSIAWTLGHGLKQRQQLARIIEIDSPLASLDLKQFGREAANDGDSYPPLPDLLTLWKKSSASLLPALKAVSDAELLRERSGLTLPHGEKRWLDACVFYVWHEAYHLGHIGVLRSQFGLTPIVDLVLAQVAEPALTNKA